MLNATLKLDEFTKEKKLYITAENDLERRFILWFAFEYNVKRTRLGKQDALEFSGQSDPELTRSNLMRAFDNYKTRFKYVEIPDFVGQDCKAACREMQRLGIRWAITDEVEAPDCPAGAIVTQTPRMEVKALPDCVVHLTVAKSRKN